MADVRAMCAIGRRGQLGLNGGLPWEGNKGREFVADVARFFDADARPRDHGRAEDRRIHPGFCAAATEPSSRSVRTIAPRTCWRVSPTG